MGSDCSEGKDHPPQPPATHLDHETPVTAMPSRSDNKIGFYRGSQVGGRDSGKTPNGLMVAAVPVSSAKQNQRGGATLSTVSRARQLAKCIRVPRRREESSRPSRGVPKSISESDLPHDKTSSLEPGGPRAPRRKHDLSRPSSSPTSSQQKEAPTVVRDNLRERLVLRVNTSPSILRTRTGFLGLLPHSKSQQPGVTRIKQDEPLKESSDSKNQLVVEVSETKQDEPLKEPPGSESQRMKITETKQDELLKELSDLRSQYSSLLKHSSDLLKNNREIQSRVEIQSLGELIDQFKLLCYNIRNSCDNFSRESIHGGHSLSESNAASLLISLGLDPKIDHQFLTSTSDRVLFSRAYISRFLVDEIFHDDESDGIRIKDLWAGKSTAQSLSDIERKMKEPEIDLLPEEFNKWRSMTVRYLSRKPLEDKARVGELVDRLLDTLLPIFGVPANHPVVPRLKNELESDIVMKAVDLSKVLRKQLSRISICIRNNPTLGSSGGKTALVLTPAMIRFTDEYGTKDTEEYVLFHPELLHLPREGMENRDHRPRRRQ